MSLYNMLFGINPASSLLKQALDLDNQSPENFNERMEEFYDDWSYDWDSTKAQALLKEAIDAKYYPTGRFRDIYFENEDEPKIILYTRNGGGNRDSYQYVFELLSQHPLYIRDYDDDFDTTYAYIEFKAPQEVIEFFDGIQTGKIDSVHEKFTKELKAYEEGKPIPESIQNFMKSVVQTIENKEEKN